MIREGRKMAVPSKEGVRVLFYLLRSIFTPPFQGLNPAQGGIQHKNIQNFETCHQ